jgi:hypothetical protein
MATYQTKLCRIEAFRWIGQPRQTWPDWAALELLAESGSALYAYTTEGPVRVNRGDWCILGDKEIHPCTNEEFLKRYEPLSFADQPADGRTPQELGGQYKDYASGQPNGT